MPFARSKPELEQGYGFEGHRFPLLLYGFEFVICVYGGYFGLGMGIVMLAIYELLGQDDILVANAVKNFVTTLVTLIGIFLFATAGLIAWMPAFIMGAGTALGGYGQHLARPARITAAPAQFQHSSGRSC